MPVRIVVGDRAKGPNRAFPSIGVCAVSHPARIWAVMALAVLLVPGCATRPHFESVRPLEYVRDLRVNPLNNVRYCTRMSEARGESSLRRLTETSDFEEIWVYLPDLRQWQEIGINEGNEIVDEKDPRYRKKSVDIDGDYLGEVANKFKRFTIYHIHNAKRRADSKVVFYNPQCCLPSYEDLCMNLKIQTFHDKLNEGHDIRFKSVSPFGVTEVQMSQYAREHFQELLAEEDVVRNDLARFETLDVYRPARFSTFKGSIIIDYRPLVKASR